MEKALDKMRRLCSRREYCISDIRSKLMKELDGDSGKVDTALKKLIDERYVSDLRYATAFARDKLLLPDGEVPRYVTCYRLKGLQRM